MRLLNTSTLKPETFDSPGENQKYAIPSHTWGPGEVLFDDMQHRPYYEWVELMRT
jgi:hypothetical protein